MSDMGDLSNLSEEELQFLVAQMQMQSDPFARAANDMGQGAGFMGLGSTPDSWDRAGDKVDLLGDFTRTTRTYFPDWVPGLFPEPERPVPYVSDSAGLYANSPAYTAVQGAMAEGMSFDEAVNLVAGKEAFAGQVPVNNYGDPDVETFRSSAEQFVQESGKEQRYADQLAEWEDYVRPQSDWDLNPNKIDDITPFLREGGVSPTADGLGLGDVSEYVRRIVENRDLDLSRVGDVAPVVEESEVGAGGLLSALADGWNNDEDDGRLSQGNGRFQTAASLSQFNGMDDYERFNAGRTADAPVFAAQSPVRNPQGGRTRPQPVSRLRPSGDTKPLNRTQTDKRYNDMARQVYEFEKNKQSKQMNASKQDQNMARLAAAYNMYVYGGR